MTSNGRPLRILRTIAIALLVAGCGGSAATASGGAGPGLTVPPAAGASGNSSTGTNADASAPAESGAPASSASTAAACTLLTDADIKTVTGLGVADRKPKFMSGVSPDGCDWTLDDTYQSEVQLAFVATDGRKFFDTYYAPFNSPLPNVGDAGVTTDTGGAMAVKGDAVVFVDYIEFPVSHKDYAKKLLQAALMHLP